MRTDRFSRLAWLLWLMTVSCQRAADPNVVLITLDTTRADRVGAMGHEAARTPNLDALASRGTIFERAYASAPITLASHATVLTGLDPNIHGVHDNLNSVVSMSLDTLAERLSAVGYRTGAFVSSVALDRHLGLDQGFDRYDDESDRDPRRLAFAMHRREAEQTTDRALEWVRHGDDRPFFVWAHYYDVHLPWYAPPPFDQLPDGYDGALAYVDSHLGRLLAGVEETVPRRPTLVIVVGDHGEGLGEHEEWAHGMVAYDSTLHVPLILAGPGFDGGGRSKAFAKTADVFPTVLAAIGEALPANASGLPLQSLTRGRDENSISYFETLVPTYAYGWARIGGVRTERWKLTAEPSPIELYDVLADPGELDNRATREPDVVARLSEAYRSLRPEVSADPAAAPAGVVEKLAALGYVSQAEHFEAGEEPDPRKLVGGVSLVDRAEMMAWEGRVTDAIEALQQLASNPRIRPVALGVLAPIYLELQRYEDAVDAYRDLAALSSSVAVRLQLASVLTTVNRGNEALALLDQIQSEPAAQHSSFGLIRARALLATNKPDEAMLETAKLLVQTPWNDTLLMLDGRARAGRDESAAIDKLREVLKEAPNSERLVQTRALLATLLYRTGRNREAREVLESTAEPSPGQRALLAEIAVADRDLEKAAAIYEQLVVDLPSSVKYARRLAQVYVNLGRGEEALRVQDEILATNPRDALAFADRGNVLARLERYVEAEKDYRKALSLNDHLPKPAFELALLLLRKKDDAEAERWLLKVVELRPDHRGAHSRLARLFEDRGDPRAALHQEKAAAGSAAKR